MLVTLAGASHPAAAARAADQVLVFRSAPITVAGFGVNQGEQVVPSPAVDGYVTGMSADIVDADGNSVPVTNVMLHHTVFAKANARDGTCGQVTDYDGNPWPLQVQRFYGLGEERSVLTLPPGYGYPNRGSDRWGLAYMLMNHKPATRTVYIQYTVHYATGQTLTPVRPYWFDEHNCAADPIFDVPGNGRMFSTFSKSVDYTIPESGRIVAAGGHLHGGGVRLDLTDRTCGMKLFTSEPTWGLPVVRPIVHEPGPKAHDDADRRNRDPRVGRRPAPDVRGLRQQPSAHPRDGDHDGVSRAGTVSKCEAVPTLPADPLSRPSAPPRMRLPLARIPAGPPAQRPRHIGRGLPVRGAASGGQAGHAVRLALHRALAPRRHARERAGRVLLAVA